MAQRRMFSKKITHTDAFLELPTSSKVLYFYLSLEADDDGFVDSPRRVMRMIGSNDDDYKILIAKKFILPFESGVCVVKHWLIHNYIQKDRYLKTQWVRERKLLKIDPETSKYQLIDENVSKMYPQDRLELGKSQDREEIPSPSGDAPSAPIPKKEYGNPAINVLLASLRESNGGAIDGSEKENRRYAHLLLGKLKTIVKNGTIEDGALYVLSAARASSFHSKNATSMKYIYNNLVKIIAEKKNNKYQIHV